MTTIDLKQYLNPRGIIQKEYITLALMLVLFLICPFLIRKIDVTAAPIDAGALSAIVMAIVALLTFKSLTWWLIQSIWPVFAVYSTFRFEDEFNALASKQKVRIYLAFYFLLLFSFVLTFTTLI